MTEDRGRDDDRRAPSFAETIEQQAEHEELEREKGDFQEAVDAERSGERPDDPPDNVSST